MKSSVQCALKPRCVLKLFSSPLLSGVLFGLDTSVGQLVPDAKLFHCCEASGQLFNQEKNIVFQCEIKRRLSLVNELFSIMQKTDPINAAKFRPKSLSDPLSTKALNIIATFASSSRQALLINEDPKIQSIPLIWLLAFSAAWRFGIRVEAAPLGGAHRTALAASIAHQQAEEKLWIVSQINRISDPALAFDLEIIISEAYHSRSRIIVITQETDAQMASCGEVAKVSKANSGFFTKGSLSKKARDIKSRGWRQFLQADSISRLEEMISEGKSS